MSDDELRNMQAHIVQRTRETWEEHRRPYMLAEVAPDLKSLGIEYKPLIFPETLKRFVQNTLASEVKVVTHPDQRTKIALVPQSVNFQFDAPVQRRLNFVDHLQNRTSSSHSSRDALLQFLEALNQFPPDEVDQVVIPTSLLVRMVQHQGEYLLL